MNNICPSRRKKCASETQSVSFFLTDNRRQLQRAGRAADEWGILIVWFGQVGWQRVGVVYCKQSTVI